MRRVILYGSVMVMLVACGAAQAVSFDFTGGVGASTTINGAIFRVDDPSGPPETSELWPFVRLEGAGTPTPAEGYNTSGRPTPFCASVNSTHDMKLSNVGIVTENGKQYYGFALDISGCPQRADQYLLLDKVQIYTSPFGGKTTTNVDMLGTLRYSMDLGGDKSIMLDTSRGLVCGENLRGDMTMLVPVSAFAGASPNDYMYLYSSFTTKSTLYVNGAPQRWGSPTGYQEWATYSNNGDYNEDPPPAVPEPMTMLLLGMGVIGVGAKVRNRIKA